MFHFLTFLTFLIFSQIILTSVHIASMLRILRKVHTFGPSGPNCWDRIRNNRTSETGKKDENGQEPALNPALNPVSEVPALMSVLTNILNIPEK